MPQPWPSVIGWPLPKSAPPEVATPTAKTTPEPEPEITISADDGWREWLAALFPDYVAAGFAPRHIQLWEWAWSISLGTPARPFVSCWPRGGGKSTTTELMTALWGARGQRKYVVYVCETQEQADDHVQNIAELLESAAFNTVYPEMGDRLVGKFGSSKGWRRNRLRTASGFVVDALGLDTASRGRKLGKQRPDAFICDDLDGEDDTEATTKKKHRTLTRKILPAAGPGCVYMFVQNKVFDDSLMAQCLDGRADFFGGRIVSGPYPAIEGLETVGDGDEARIVGGKPTWAGQSLEVCQDFIRTWGLDAFKSECQHESVQLVGRFLASIDLWDACEDATLPKLDAHTPVVLGLDAGESSDTFALVAVSRHPRNPARLAVRFSRGYVPTEGKVLDFDLIEEDIRAFVKVYAVRELTYDRFLMGQMIRRLTSGEKKFPVPLEPFSQNADRLEADKALQDSIIDRTLAHDGTHTTLREHLDNANAKSSADGRQVRIVKRSQKKKVDLAVALSMSEARAAVVLPKAVRSASPQGTQKQSAWSMP